MATKTFSAGEVLTASDTNTYLANSGLVYVATGTVTSGTTLGIDSVFSATYVNYRLVINATVGSNGLVNLNWRTGSGDDVGANYKWGRSYFRLDNGNTGTNGNTADTSINFATLVANTPTAFTLDVFNPFVALNTVTTCSPHIEATGSTATSYQAFSSSVTNTTTSYTGVKITFPGTISTATIRIYGYRQA